MSELATIYRSCPTELDPATFKRERPHFFDKLKCFDSFYNSFVGKSDIHIVWDGATNNFLFNHIKSLEANLKIYITDLKSNQGSLNYCYNLAEQLSNRFICFAEDDYCWLPGSYEFMVDALKLGYDPLTLYNHADRYLVDKLGWYTGGTDETWGQDLIGLTNLGYVRTCESTTCSFACSKKFFNLTKDSLYHFNNIGVGAPEDRKFWRSLNKTFNIRLWSALPGLSCHMSLPLTPHVDWNL